MGLAHRNDHCTKHGGFKGYNNKAHIPVVHVTPPRKKHIISCKRLIDWGGGELIDAMWRDPIQNIQHVSRIRIPKPERVSEPPEPSKDDSAVRKDGFTLIYVYGVQVQVYTDDVIGTGIQRKVYPCDYTRDGKSFVVKEARNTGGEHTNRMEYHIYQFAKHTQFGVFVPIFEHISTCGKWLVVEECISRTDMATDEHRINPYEVFPSFMHNDLHGANWGYTVDKPRPVMFDLGFNLDGLNELSQAVGMPQEVLNTI